MLNNLPFLISAPNYLDIFMGFISKKPRVKRKKIGRLEEATKNGDNEYWLSQEDIADIARIEYHNYNINDVFSEFEITGSIRHFSDLLNKFETHLRGQERAHFTLIINLGNRHWVTLVLFYEKKEGYVSSLLPGFKI